MLLIVVAKHNRAEMLNSNTPPAAKAYLLPPGTVAVAFHEFHCLCVLALKPP